jgi:hypothetical protein
MLLTMMPQCSPIFYDVLTQTVRHFVVRRELKTDLRLWDSDGLIDRAFNVVCDSAIGNEPSPAPCHINSSVTKHGQNERVLVCGQHGKAQSAPAKFGRRFRFLIQPSISERTPR